jgi:UDP-glucose 4-epimerase
MHVLITGGAGYVGTELVRRLVGRDDVEAVTVYDNLSRKNYGLFTDPSLATDKVHFVRGDLLDSRSLRAALEGVDAVVHLAAKVVTPFGSDDTSGFDQVNNWGSAELAYAVEESDVSRLLYLSSAAVYGSSPEILDDDAPPGGTSFYGVSKRMGEGHVRRLEKKLKTWIVRSGNVYGFSPSMRFDTVVNRFVFDAHFSGRISILGDGHQKRAFISVDLLCDRLLALLLGEVPGGTYNLVGLNASILELAGSVKEHYPDLELLFLDQQFGLINQEIDPKGRIVEHLGEVDVDLLADVAELASHLSFAPSVAV